jgi:hypothetical protein
MLDSFSIIFFSLFAPLMSLGTLFDFSHEPGTLVTSFMCNLLVSLSQSYLLLEVEVITFENVSGRNIKNTVSKALLLKHEI